jgi:hypothetical protein
MLFRNKIEISQLFYRTSAAFVSPRCKASWNALFKACMVEGLSVLCATDGALELHLTFRTARSGAALKRCKISLFDTLEHNWNKCGKQTNTARKIWTKKKKKKKNRRHLALIHGYVLT